MPKQEKIFESKVKANLSSFKRIQTAEGWKRSLSKRRQSLKGASKV